MTRGAVFGTGFLRCRPPLVLVLPPVWAAVFLALFLVAGQDRVLFSDPLSTVVDGSNGELLSAIVAQDGQWRLPGIRRVPPKLAAALVTFEDRRFGNHWGFDLRAFGRALTENLKEGGVVSGGSTLSMQVIRLSRKNPDRSLSEKFWEVLGAVQLEFRFSKDQILRLFADHAPLGGNVVGVDAAAWRYFGHSPEQLSWSEAALLAVLPNSPTLLRLDRETERLKKKRDRLLGRLHDRGFFDRGTLTASLVEPMPSFLRSFPQKAPHLAEFVAQGRPAGRIRTTINTHLQGAVIDAAERRRRWLEGNSVHNAAVLVAKVSTGEVLAYVGNVGDLGNHGGFNDMVQAPRSTGSILKPLLYNLMVQSGDLLPDQLVEDIPTRVGSYVPQNNVPTYSGALPASEALARSLNIPAVRELRVFGVAKFAQELKNYGLTTLWRNGDDYGLPLILGGAEASLWDLCGVYAGVSRGAQGVPQAFFPLQAVEGAPKRMGPQPTVTPASCYMTLQAMKEVIRPNEEAAWKSFSGARKVAWKTGTSYNFKDAWAIGVTPEYVVGVWVGNADGVGRPELYGLTSAAPLMFEVFNLLPPTTWFTPPPGMKAVRTCRTSGLLAGDHCPETVQTLIPADAYPQQVCSYHQELHLDPTGRVQVDSRLVSVDQQIKKVWFVLPPAVATYYVRKHMDYVPPPPWDRRLVSLGDQGRLYLSFPEPGSQLIIPVELDGTPGQMLAEASHADPQAEIFWSLDGVYLGSTLGTHVMSMRPAAGDHLLDLSDSWGNQIRRKFQILGESASERKKK